MTGHDLITSKQQNKDDRASWDGDPELTHTADIKDRATGLVYSRFSFSTPDGRGTLDVERSLLVKPAVLLGRLLDSGAVISSGGDRKIMLELVEYAASQLPRFRCEYVAHTGWQPDFSGYSTKEKVIARGAGDRRLLPPRQERRLAARSDFACKKEDWIRNVATWCCHSQLGLFMLTAGFAPPLLELLNLPSFGINLFGPSKKGKSTLLLAASSIYGARVESDLMNFATTSAALGEACRLHNSALLPLNEAGLIKGDRRQAYKVIRPCIFQLTEGREFARHSKSGFATAEDLAKYRLIFAATSEHPMSFYAAEAGQHQDDGELARSIDIPILRRNRVSVVDTNLRHVKVREGETVAGTVLKAIRSGCERSGAAMPILDFVRRIMDDPDGVREEVVRLQSSFIALVTRDHFDDVDRHRAMCFGALAAAGQLACRWGFIPISDRSMLQVVRRVFDQACQTRVRIKDVMRESQEYLRTRLSTLPNENDYAARLPDNEGYRKRSEGGIEYYVHEASFKEWFRERPTDLTCIMKWLKDRDAFQLVQARNPTEGDIKSYSLTRRWPSGKQVRCIILRHQALLRGDEASD